jgi:GNAT superfamily N-acetyltransferase
MQNQDLLQYKLLEFAAFSAWPAKEQFERSGIVYRISSGYTKRANSANIIGNINSSYTQLIENTEQLFADKELPCVFRTLSFSPQLELEQHLKAKQYQNVNLSCVLSKKLQVATHQLMSDQTKIEVLTISEWFECFCTLNKQDNKLMQGHLDILLRIKDPCCAMVLRVKSEVVACVLGVIHEDLLGVFDLYSAEHVRGKGYASMLIQAICKWAWQQGATQSYLQVLASNKSALALYEHLDYQHCYQYSYWIKVS